VKVFDHSFLFCGLRKLRRKTLQRNDCFFDFIAVFIINPELFIAQDF